MTRGSLSSPDLLSQTVMAHEIRASLAWRCLLSGGQQQAHAYKHGSWWLFWRDGQSWVVCLVIFYTCCWTWIFCDLLVCQIQVSSKVTLLTGVTDRQFRRLNPSFLSVSAHPLHSGFQILPSGSRFRFPLLRTTDRGSRSFLFLTRGQGTDNSYCWTMMMVVTTFLDVANLGLRGRIVLLAMTLLALLLT